MATTMMMMAVMMMMMMMMATMMMTMKAKQQNLPQAQLGEELQAPFSLSTFLILFCGLFLVLFLVLFCTFLRTFPTFLNSKPYSQAELGEELQAALEMCRRASRLLQVDIANLIIIQVSIMTRMTIMLTMLAIITIQVSIMTTSMTMTLCRLRSPGRTTRVKQSFFRMGSRFRYR